MISFSVLVQPHDLLCFIKNSSFSLCVCLSVTLCFSVQHSPSLRNLHWICWRMVISHKSVSSGVLGIESSSHLLASPSSHTQGWKGGLTDTEYMAVSGLSSLWRCGCELHPGGVGLAGPWSEETLQRCDAGDLQEPGLCGWGQLPPCTKSLGNSYFL